MVHPSCCAWLNIKLVTSSFFDEKIMLKQTFDQTAITKVLTPEDVWRWDVWSKPEEKDNAIEALANSVEVKAFKISSLKCETKRGKPTYQATNIEDVIAIRLLDRYIRRIYKVRQSDRNRIISQVKTILKDSGEYIVLRLDIKHCYESMDLEKSINKLANDMILAPSCMQLLYSILESCKSAGINGLPRGLAISPTLAELYLETIDKCIKGEEGVIYATRYVDDFFILIDKTKANGFRDNLKSWLEEIGLNLNEERDKQYIGPSNNAEFNYLGYAIYVRPAKGKGNKVSLTISKKKLDKIKQKVAISLNEHKKAPNINLLKQRLSYLTVLKVIKNNGNGTLLGGLAYNYRYVSDEFCCLKTIDGFLMKMINHSRFSFSQEDKTTLSKISFYSAVSKNKLGKFTRSKAARINRVWKDA